ncbi:hypothetical protein Tbd_1790 [Thiobacillus denitrificans ATCC 25259]|uniref:Uncharacterized protein n=1 Tax=Thiobacillus denitrificans (strain ATCC 25259 / T1) TaxID=292415 RepID=Q3SHZ0_THIDA|nr:hypothetical protein [Thiobacillus denitrificans]AAZ97743.1 hypothetical protein Tbd_1790 [Thiobacillus denitrificans ATCC 25259]
MKSQWFGRSAAIGQYSTHTHFSVLGVLAFMLVAIALILLAALMGASLAIGFWPFAVALVGGVFVLGFYAVLGGRSGPGLRDSFFWLAFVLIFATDSLKKVTGYSANFVLEFSLILAAPLLVPTLVRLLSESRFFKWWFAGLSVFFILSLLSSFFGRSHVFAAAFQFLTNLKFILILLLGFYIVWSARTEAIFWWIVRWLWLPTAMLVAWQWGHPSSYFGLMPYATASADPLQLFPSRAVGPFSHPTYLGLYMGVLTVFCVINAISGAGRRYFVIALCYFLLLLASAQRQETVAAIVAATAAVGLLHGKRFALRSAVIGLVTVLAVGGGAWLLIKDNLVQEATKWGVIGHSAIQQPRQVLYIHAVEIADQYAPLGSGLGTFAGAGAQKFDISLYLDRGFARYSWFYKQNVLMDTYWTNFLAETGWAGALLLLALTLLLVAFTAVNSLEKYPSEIRRFWLLAFGGMAFVFLLSLTSPSFQDPGLFLVPGIFLGVAYNRMMAWKKPTKRG